METSTQINELAEALSKFQGKMKPVIFDSSNPYYKSKYASLSALVSCAAPILSENGLSVTQILEEDGTVETLLLHKSGQWLSSRLKLNPVKSDPQGVGSAITYTRRYSYAAILGLVSDEDDDGNAASGLNDKKQNTSTEMPKPKKPDSNNATKPSDATNQEPVQDQEATAKQDTRLSAKSIANLNKAMKYLGEDIKKAFEICGIKSGEEITSDEIADKVYTTAYEIYNAEKKDKK